MLEKKVRRIIAEKLGIGLEEVRPEAAFLEDLGVDSLDMVELIMTMEDEFGIVISDEEGEEIRTIQAAIDFIRTRAEKGA